MARIPEEEVERLKREVSVQRLAEARGIDVRTAGLETLDQLWNETKRAE